MEDALSNLTAIPLVTWIAIPLIGGLIGYITNRLAVKMIFRPIRRRNVLGIKIQGLLGRRQQELADSIGEVVGDHLLRHEDVVESFQRVDLEAMLEDVLERGMQPKVEELRSLPLIGGFLTDDRITDLRKALTRGILDHRETILEKLEEAVEEGLDVRSIVREKVAAFPVEKLEKLVLQVASRELRAIEWLGALLGILIGLTQVVVIGLWG